MVEQPPYRQEYFQTMSKSYPSTVKNFCDSSLLHLYLSCSETTRFVPIHRRNEWLLKYLKPQLNKSEYKPLKKDIKSLLLLGKQRTADLEKQLLKLRGLVDNFDNDVEQFYSLLSVFEDELHLPSSLQRNPSLKEQICISEQSIDAGFDKSGSQIAPLCITVYSSQWPEIDELVQKHGWFRLEVKETTSSDALMSLHKI